MLRLRGNPSNLGVTGKCRSPRGYIPGRGRTRDPEKCLADVTKRGTSSDLERKVLWNVGGIEARFPVG